MEQTTIIPSPTTYLPMVVETEQTTNIGETIIDAEIITEEATATPFIEANSTPITLESLQNDCVIPNFAKDNEAVISHSQFIGATYQALRDFYRSEQIDEPQIRVSHIIRGRIPEAINKKSSELLPHEMTQYYERMAFCINVPTIYQDVNGNRLQLSIVGVKSYGRDNLNGKLTAQKFSIAVGFQKTVCCNQCIWTDGYKDDIRALSPGKSTNIPSGCSIPTTWLSISTCFNRWETFTCQRLNLPLSWVKCVCITTCPKGFRGEYLKC